MDGIRWWLDPAVPAAVARPLLERALEQRSAGAANLRQGRRKQLYRIADPGSGDAWLLKVNHYPRGTRRLRTSKARRELAIAIGLRAREIETPVPIAAGEARSGLRLDRCYLLVRVLPGFRDLRQALLAGDPDRRQRSRWIEALGRTSRRLHDTGLLQHDFAPNNFLVHGENPESIQPVDFERARLRRRVGRGARRRMLAKLERHLAEASAADRLRFLHAYHAGDGRAARRSWWKLAREGARLAARDRARLRRLATRDGRRFEILQWGEWSGWARRGDPDLARVASLLVPPSPAGPPASQALRIEADGCLWCGSGNRTPGEAAEIWARALTLWARGGLSPRPIACLTRGGSVRFWCERNPSELTLLQLAGSAAARDAAAVLVDRLQRLGRLDPWLSPRKLALARRPDGRLRAHLLDPEAFRPGPRRRFRTPPSGAAFVRSRLEEIEARVERIAEPAG